MKNKLRRLLSATLAFIMSLSMVNTAFADSPTEEANRDVEPRGSVTTIYVAASSAGGSDYYGDGSETDPYLTIGNALSKVTEGEDVELILKSDINLSAQMNIDSTVSASSITFKAYDNGNYSLHYTGTEAVGVKSGVVVVNGKNVTFDGVGIDNSGNNHAARLLDVSDAEVVIRNAELKDGNFNNSAGTMVGGAGVRIDQGGKVTIESSTVLRNNQTNAAGGAAYVADGGLLIVEGAVIGNKAALGGGIYAEKQTQLGEYGLIIRGDANITGNNVTENGGGVYLAGDSKASVSGDVTISGNTKNSSTVNNVYLAAKELDATDETSLDISGATVDANIGITADSEYAYRLISKADEYDITPTRQGDEMGWTDDCGEWEIRYMKSVPLENVYNGEGLYLYYKTLDVQFEDVDTLASIEGSNINETEAVDYLANAVDGSTNENGVLLVPGVLPIIDETDYVVTIICNEEGKEYRIPTADIIALVSGDYTLEPDVDYTYEPDFENGTAKITVFADTIKNLTDKLEFHVSAEKYFALTLAMEGPLYALTGTSISGQTSDVVVASGAKTGDTAEYTVQRGGNGLAGVTVHLHREGAGTVAASAVTNENGVASFAGLDEVAAYYPVISYRDTYYVISRDEITLQLSCLDGQELDSKLQPGAITTGECDYNAATGAVTIANVTADGVDTFYIKQSQDTVTFYGNEDHVAYSEGATTRPATITLDSGAYSVNAEKGTSTLTKTMVAAAATYGEMPVATMKGYTFVGWFTAAVGGEQVTADSEYTSDTARELYAHWLANGEDGTDSATAFVVDHWVEYVAGGENKGYVAGVTELKTEGTKSYYLYRETEHEGVSDTIVDLSNPDLALTEMDDGWDIRGFVVSYEENAFIGAAGESALNIYYDRAQFAIKHTTPLQAGTAKDETPIDDTIVYYGAPIGELADAHLPGYTFGGWYDGARRIQAADIYNTVGDTTVTAMWTANNNTPWVIRVMTQNLSANGNVGLDTFTALKTVTVDNDGNKLIGTTDTYKDGNIADFDSLSTHEDIIGFHYIGYNNDGSLNRSGVTLSNDGSFKAYVSPTDMDSTAENGNFDESFDGGIVYLYFDRNTRNVVIDVDHDDAPIEDSGKDIIYGHTFKDSLPDDPGRDGYDFTGWVDEDGNPVTEDTLVDKYTDDESKTGTELVLTATWSARDYNLTYVPGENASIKFAGNQTGNKSTTVIGGYVDPNTVTYDQPVGSMPEATKKGHDFTGWHINDVDGALLVETDIVSVANVVISNAPVYNYENTRPLYASYTPHSYTILLDAGRRTIGAGTEQEQVIYGEVDPESITVTYGEKVTGLPVPTLEGYRFVGWYLDVSKADSLVSNGDYWEKNGKNGDIFVLHASWLPKTYAYTFDLNDSIGSTKGRLIGTEVDYVDYEFGAVYGDEFGVEASRPGYIFKGWALRADGEPLQADEIVSIATNATLFAIWQPRAYNVKLVMHGGTIADPATGEYYTRYAEDYNLTTSYDDDADVWTMKVLFDTAYGDLAEAVKDNCKFNGWAADAPGWDRIDGTVISSLPTYIDYADKDGITLEALLEPYFTFNPGDGKFDDDTTDPKSILQSELGDKLPDVIKDGFDHQGWQDDEETRVTIDDLKQETEPKTLTPILVPIITFDANGGKIGENDTEDIPQNKIDELPVPTCEDYTFDGWFNGEDKVSLEDIKNTTEPMTVIAKWVINATFDANGGKVKGNNTYDVAAATLAELPTPVRSGYTFNGWYTERAGGEPVTIEEVNAATEHVTYYAHWTNNTPPSSGGSAPATTYIVTFDSNGGTAVPEQETTGKVTKPVDPLRAGYILTGWFTKTGEQFDFDKDRVRDDTTLMAHWVYVGPSAYLTTDHIAYIAGYTDGTVRPNANITRAEVAMIFYRLLNEKTRGEYKTTENGFDDVLEGMWHETAIATLANMGILLGHSATEFDSDVAITRAEFAVICARFDDVSDGELTFTDVPADHWAAKYIGSAAAKGWVKGYDDGSFHPEDNITRAEAMTLINRVLRRDGITTDSLLDEMKTWPDNNESLWHYLAVQEATNGHDYIEVAEVETWTALHDTEVTND